MAFQTKNSNFAMKEEVTEGTYLAPTAVGDYLPVREGFDLVNEQEQLENDSLTGSLGVAKSTVGIVSPTSSIPLYFHGSGVEGSKPDISDPIKGALGGEVEHATEYNTVAASTTQIIKVDAGEGVNFSRGHMLLIKDSTNGYSIRPVHSVSGDDLTLGFAVATAPGTGVNLGKAVQWSPQSSLPTYSLTDYRGNGGVIQAAAGMRVGGFDLSATAGQFVEFSPSLQGIKYFWNPTTVASGASDAIDFNDGGAQSITISAKTYLDPYELAAELQSKMDAASSDTITVVYSSTTGKFTVTTDGAALAVNWATTVNTAGAHFGFTADDTGSLTYVSDSAYTLVSPQTPTFDAEKTLVAKDNVVLIGDGDEAPVCVDMEEISISLTNTINFADSVCASTGRGASAVTGREFEIEMSGELKAYEADYFRRLRTGDNTRLLWVSGVRESAGGNWVAGKNMASYVPTATVTSVNVVDNDELVYVSITLKPYVESGLGEFYINQV